MLWAWCSHSTEDDSIRRWRARHLPRVYCRCPQLSAERTQTLVL
jgi:hypothetical protein